MEELKEDILLRSLDVTDVFYHKQSKRIRKVARSTLAAETLAMANAIDNGLYLASLLHGVDCLTDCYSLKDAILSTKQVAEKRLRIEISSIRELLQQKKISEVKWIESENQLADCLTKKRTSCLNLLKALQTGAWVNKCLEK